MGKQYFIRSQDKTKLTEDFNFSIKENKGTNEFYIENCKVGVVGKYSTFENAIYVLDKISQHCFDETHTYQLPEDEVVTKNVAYMTMNYFAVFISLQDENDTYIVKVPDLDLEIKEFGKEKATNAIKEAIKLKYESFKNANKPVPSPKRYYGADFIDELKENPGSQYSLSNISIEVRK